jgi:hypothetical protein
MTLTRRGLLTAALAGSGLLAGCSGGPDGTEAESASTGGEGGDATATPAPTTTPTATATATPTADPDLSATTSAILAEVDWFHTAYGPAIRGLRVTINRTIGTIEDLEAVENPTESDLATLRAATTDVADYVQSKIADHFVVDRALRVGENVYVRDFERALARDDAAMQAAVLSRTRAFYRRAVSRSYLRNAFSRRPIYAPLYDTLVPGEGDRIVAVADPETDYVTWSHPDRTDSSADDGVDQHVHEFGDDYRVFGHAHGHSAGHSTRNHENEPPADRLYAYGDGGVALFEDAAPWHDRLDDYEPILTDVFGPVTSPNRARGLYFLVGTVDDAFTSTPLYVEQFDSADAARRAVAPSDAVSTEGTASFAGREWSRIYYQLDDTTVYAYRFRSGRTVVATRPSDAAWEERADWTTGLGPTWIAATPPEDTQ